MLFKLLDKNSSFKSCLCGSMSFEMTTRLSEIDSIKAYAMLDGILHENIRRSRRFVTEVSQPQVKLLLPLFFRPFYIRAEMSALHETRNISE